MTKHAINRPFKYGARDRHEFIVSDGEVEIRAQNDASGNVLYLGFAKAGSGEGEDVWQISFHAWDGNDALTSRTWPEDSLTNASTNYEFNWTGRAGYTYS